MRTRPPPASAIAWPTSCVSTLTRKPERGDSTLNALSVNGRMLDGSSHTRGLPPCASTFLRKVSRAAPDSWTNLMRSRATSTEDSRFANTTILAASSIERSSTGRAASSASPRSSSMHSLTSVEFPTAQPSGWFMSVISACDRTPREFPVFTNARANCFALSGSRMNAPEPVFTSMTIASKPAAPFFEMIDATINGIASMVAVASRSAYNFLSAGAISAVCPFIAKPAVSSTERNSFSERSTR